MQKAKKSDLKKHKRKHSVSLPLGDVAYSLAQVWELRIIRPSQRRLVRSLNDLDIWKEEHSRMDVLVEQPRAAAVAGLLHDNNIAFSVSVADLDQLIQSEGNQLARSRASGAKVNFDWDNYYRLDVIHRYMDSLAREHVYICETFSIGKSVENRDLKVLKVSNGCPHNEAVWVDGAIHAREWITPAAVLHVAHQLVTRFQSLSDSITSKDWYLMPVLNPDGYEYTHTTDRMWRKNRSRHGECVGVDLNRNFGHAWGEKGEEGSSEDPGSIFYRGPKPFSEPEAEAVRKFITESDSVFRVFLSLHSYAEVIIFPWGFTSEPCPDYVRLLEAASAMSKAIKETAGLTYKVGGTKDLMYYAAGTSIDWSYAEAGIPYSYMVELRSRKDKFMLPRSEILPTCAETFNGIIKMVEYIEEHHATTDAAKKPAKDDDDDSK